MIKSEKEVENKTDSSLDLGVFTVYDTVLGVFDSPFVCRISELDDICRELCNNVSSRYYYNTSNYEVYQTGFFNTKSGHIYHTDELGLNKYICRLDSYLDENKRKIQLAIQTLNYLPNGYFKMPDEMKKTIQEKIDNAIQVYCEEFIDNNPDVVTQYSQKVAD